MMKAETTKEVTKAGEVERYTNKNKNKTKFHFIYIPIT